VASFSEEFFFSDITTIQQALLKKEFTVRELTEAYCDRLERLGPRFNALALSLREDANRKAKEVADDFKKSRIRSKVQGIPFGAKDLLAVEKKITTWGAKPFQSQVLPYTATVLKKLDKKGAILTGKLSMVELAGGGGYRFPNASLQGPGLNPWNREMWSGGSSSGTGSAVAAGLVGFGLGSETSGSILTPSAYCGVTGLRPTYGLVSRFGAMALSWTMDKIGPMCRSARDCGLVLDAIAGGDNADAGSAKKSFYYAPEYQEKSELLTVAYAPVDFQEWSDEALRPVLAEALKALQTLGIKLVEKEIPDFPYGALTSAIIGAEGASIFEPLIRSGEIDQLADKAQIAGLKEALEIPARDYLKAMRMRRQISDRFMTEFRDVDLILAPTRTSVATPVRQALDVGSNRAVPKSRGFSGLIPATNLTGWPAISLPCGLANGLPVAIQLVAKPWRENLLLAVGERFQQATNFHQLRPKL
jgi:aspartyl-tRNA(Asn)/glutamyl-tRNA(Gln) amidotransferase subunit A